MTAIRTSRRLTGAAALALASLRISIASAQSAPAPILKVVESNHALALRADSTIIGWGRYRDGQLGEQPVLTSKRRFGVAAPVPIPMPGKVIDIAVGEDASYALMADGTVYGWGSNFEGQLGLGNKNAPTLPNGERGFTSPQRIGGLSNVVQIAAMNNTAYAVLRDGTVRAWGERDGGAIGDRIVPIRWGVAMPPALTPVTVPGATNVRTLSVGGGHAVALTNDGRVLTWGVNSSGELGTGSRNGGDSTGSSYIAHVVEMQPVADVVQAVAGSGVTGLVKRDGTVWMIGSLVGGLFGIPEARTEENDGWSGVPKAVPGVRNVASLTMGDVGRHALALLKDGTLRGWGNSDWGQIGNGVAGFFVWTPVIPKLTGVTAVWAAGNNSFAVTRDGGFYIWGTELGGTGILAVNHKLPTLFPLP